MKTNVMLVGMALFLVFGLSGAAQEQAAPQDFQPGQWAAELKTRLQLTEDQLAQITPILQEQIELLRAAIEEYREQGMAGRQSLKAEVQKFIEDIRTRIVPLLIPER